MTNKNRNFKMFVNKYMLLFQLLCDHLLALLNFILLSCCLNGFYRGHALWVEL